MTNLKRSLPLIPNAEQLRKQAKARLAQMRTRSPGARLSQAQTLLAADYGFANWAELLTEVSRRRPRPLDTSVRRARFAVPSFEAGEGFESDAFPNWVGAAIAGLFLGILAVGLTFMPFPAHDTLAAMARLLTAFG